MVIVDDPEKGISENNLIFHEGLGTPCKHLRGESPGAYSCSVHDKPWYCETPCAAHTQFERRPETPCRLGVYTLNKLTS